MHLHIPDGVLPAWLWLPGLAVSLALLVWASRGAGEARRRQVAYQSSLGALALAAMAVEIPLGPLEYHLTLVGPLGVLLGPAGSFQTVFTVNAILALIGHGGLTTVGLNALVLGTGAVVARPAYVVLARRLAPAPALALTTASAHALSGALWLVLVGFALRLPGSVASADPARVGIVAGLAFPMWLVGIAAESAVAYGIGSFVGRVRPDLLPGAGDAVGGGGSVRPDAARRPAA